MKTLEQALSVVRAEPFRYLPAKSLAMLRNFVAGMSRAVVMEESDRTKERFNTWVARKFRLSRSQNAFSILALVSEGDQQAFDRYFIEWDLYCKEWGDRAERFKLSPIERDWRSLASDVRRQIGDLLSARSVRYLRAAIDGIVFAQQFTGVFSVSLKTPIEFERWLCGKHNSWTSIYRWEEALTFLCGGSEEKACERFFEVFEEWQLSEKEKNIE